MKIENKNLFSDIYELKEKIDNIDAANEMKKMAGEVKLAIENNLIPEKIRFILLKTTNKCNSSCMYCSHALNRIHKEEKFSIPSETIMKLLDEAKEMGVEAISISGGEPLVRKDICSIINKIKTCGIMPVLLTNGLLLPEMWEELGEAGLRYVIISFDSVTKDIYEKQRGVSFSKALKGIEAAIKMREKYKDVEIHVSAVLTKDNHSDFIELLDFMNRRQIKVQISPYHKRIDDAEDYSIAEKEKIVLLTEKLIDMKKHGYLIANSEAFIRHLPDFFCGNMVMPKDFRCKVGYTSLAIDTYMNIKPCWSFMYEPIGNLQDMTLKEAWESKKMKEYRRKMLRNECEGCWYLCTSEICMLLDSLVKEV